MPYPLIHETSPWVGRGKIHGNTIISCVLSVYRINSSLIPFTHRNFVLLAKMGLLLGVSWLLPFLIADCIFFFFFPPSGFFSFSVMAALQSDTVGVALLPGWGSRVGVNHVGSAPDVAEARSSSPAPAFCLPPWRQGRWSKPPAVARGDLRRPSSSRPAGKHREGFDLPMQAVRAAAGTLEAWLVMEGSWLWWWLCVVFCRVCFQQQPPKGSWRSVLQTSKLYLIKSAAFYQPQLLLSSCDVFNHARISQAAPRGLCLPPRAACLPAVFKPQ